MPLAMFLGPLAMDLIRRLKRDSLRHLLSALVVFVILLLPLVFSLGDAFMNYGFSCVCAAMFLKIAQLFFTHPLPRLKNMSSREFWVRFTMFPDPAMIHEYELTLNRDAWKTSPQLRTRVKRTIWQGRWASLRMGMFALGYWLGLQFLLLILPKHPSKVLKQGSWLEFWMLMELSGWGTWLLLGLMYTGPNCFLGFVFGVKNQDVFNKPFMSTSLRDWWSRRWNLVFKDQFYDIVFSMLNPGIKTPSRDYKKTDGDKENKETRVDARTKSIAALATFLFSGVLHEYYVLATFGPEYVGWNVVYFLLHGLLTTLETLFLAHRMRSGWPNWIRIITTHLILLSLMPFFQIPYLLNEMYMKSPVILFPGTRNIYSYLIFNSN